MDVDFHIVVVDVVVVVVVVAFMTCLCRISFAVCERL